MTPPPLVDADAEGVAPAVPGVGVTLTARTDGEMVEMVGEEEMLTGGVPLTNATLDNTEGEPDTEGAVVDGEALGVVDGDSVVVGEPISAKTVPLEDGVAFPADALGLATEGEMIGVLLAAPLGNAETDGMEVMDGATYNVTVADGEAPAEGAEGDTDAEG
jgi:hypothetical protein